MTVPPDTVLTPSAESTAPQHPTLDRITLPRIEVVRAGNVESLLNLRPTLSSAGVQWGGIALEGYTVPACHVPRHEHREHFLHVVLRVCVKYEVATRGRTLLFTARPGTTFILPRGTVDELRWAGPTHRLAMAIHPLLLTNALDETADETDIEPTEHWDLLDRHITALLLEMAADLKEGSPAGQIYGDSVANALAVYLVKRYAVQPRNPAVYRGGLPKYSLKRVLEYIAENLAEDRMCHAATAEPEAQCHRSGVRRRLSEPEPFRPHVSKTCRHHSVEVSGGATVRLTTSKCDALICFSSPSTVGIFEIRDEMRPADIFTIYD